jgi:putative dehydrogenase
MLMTLFADPLKPRVGLIGLGAMGAGMAASLRRAGFAPQVFDIRPGVADAFAREGGTACASVAELAQACDVVISVVVNAQQTEQVLFGGNGDAGASAAMKPGSVFVMCSTVDPNVSIAFEQRLQALGLLYLDAPISGGAAKAAAGQMTMMTAGTPAAYARCGGVLDALAAQFY